MRTPVNAASFQLSKYGMTEEELKMITIDLAILDALYKKWGEEDSSLSGVTNAKLITPKN